MPVIAIVGPSGGTGGRTFGDLPQDDFKVIRITIRSGDVVDAIQMTHERPDGTLAQSEPRAVGIQGPRSSRLLGCSASLH